MGSVVAGQSQRSEVIAVDLPGFGESDEPPEAWSTIDYANFTAHFLESIDVKRCHVVGHSFGGRVAIRLAASSPDSVVKLVLCDSAGIRPKRSAKFRLKVFAAKVGRLVGKMGPWGRKLQDQIRNRVGSSDYLSATEVMRGTLKKTVDEDLTKLLTDIKSETLIVWGELDEDTPVWMAERMESEIPNSGLYVIQGAGHFSYAEKPDVFNAAVSLFIEPASG